MITAISLLAIPGHWFPTGQNASEVVLLIGMAVGIDYCLFYLRREREERAKGATISEAVRIAAGTSGRAIVISGLTVMIALAGLFLTGVSVFTGMAFGAITVVGVAVIGSLTFLPALLSWLGRWADRGRIPFLGRRRTAAKPSRLWAALVRRVVRRPVLWGGAAALALLALAAPALGMRLGTPANDVPNNVPIVVTYHRIQHAFPQAPSPAQVVVTGTGLSGPAVRHAVAEVADRVSAGGPIRGPVTATPVGGRPRPDRQRPARGQRHGHQVQQRPARAQEPGPPGHPGPGPRHQLRRDRQHRGELRRHPADQGHHPSRAGSGGGPGVHAVAGRVPVGHAAADVDSPQPAVGRGRLRADHADLPGRSRCRGCWASPATA